MPEIEYRPVRIIERRKTKIGTKITVSEGLFHCWSSEQWPATPLLRNESGGQMQTIYGIVEMKDGSINKVSPEEMQFLDNKVSEYPFPDKKEDK